MHDHFNMQLPRPIIDQLQHLPCEFFFDAIKEKTRYGL